MILLTVSDYARFKTLVLTTLGGPTAQRRVFYSNTAPGSFTALAAIPGAGGGSGGEETVGVILPSTSAAVPATFLTDFPGAILVDSFGVI
jgi:hypothetical protein